MHKNALDRPTCSQEVEDGAGGHVVESQHLFNCLLVGVALLDGGDEVTPEVKVTY